MDSARWDGLVWTPLVPVITGASWHVSAVVSVDKAVDRPGKIEDLCTLIPPHIQMVCKYHNFVDNNSTLSSH